jgi:hypothetical protein
MEQTITDEQIAELCMFMRVLELLKKNPQVLVNTEMNNAYVELSGKVDEIMKLLTEEQLDIVLETHKIQLEELEEEFKKKARKKKKNAK